MLEIVNEIQKRKRQTSHGITLISLVITIIVLLILAGVTITLTMGENGIFNVAKKAVKNYVNASEREIAEIAGFNNRVQDVISGTEENQLQKIDREKSYVGYYADIDADGIVDGIIYDDDYFSKDTKDYYVKIKDYHTDEFGTKDVLSPIGIGKERFYVMDLSDFNGGHEYAWYTSAYGNMSDYDSTTSSIFGSGKTNTETMINIWNVGVSETSGTAVSYGEKSDNDLWGAIQERASKGWFVPSCEELDTFVDALGIDQSNCNAKGINGIWHTSTQSGISTTYSWWFEDFEFGLHSSGAITSDTLKVRLSTTF